VSDRINGRTSIRGRMGAALGSALLIALSGAFPLAVSADPASPISVVKTANPNPVASGDELTYTITITNTGGSKVDEVVLTDQVNGVGVVQTPPALPQLQITSSKGSCTQGGANGNLVTCLAGSLAGREVWTVTIRGQVTAANGTTLNNTAAVTGTRSAQTFNTTASVSVLVQGSSGGGSNLPDLSINKTGPTSVAAGAAMLYTLTVVNLGTVNTANVRVVDTLPSGVTLDATTPFETTSLFTCASDGASPIITVTCTGGSVNSGQNATIKIHAIAPSPAPSPNTITNTAVVDPDNAIAESNELNNTSSSVNTTVGGPPPVPLLTIFKTDNNPTSYPWSFGAGPDPVNPGEMLVYKIQAKNNATSRADDVVITDGTNGLAAASITASQTIVGGTLGNTGGCVVNAPQVRCSIKWLDPGGTLTVTITGTVVAASGSTIFNTATVNGNIKNVGVTSTDSEATTVRPSIDFTITKVDSPDPVCARSWPRDFPPLGETGHLANSPIPPAPPAATGQVESPQLLAPAVCLGGLTYDFVIGNSGNGSAIGNVTVRDPLPPGVILDSYANGAGVLDGGFACKLDPGNVVVCTGGSIGAGKTVNLSFRLVAPPDVGSITNVVTVDPNNAIFESDETNNTASATTNVKTGVDLVVWKGDKMGQDVPGDGAPNLSEGFDPIATNGTGTYTIIVDNVGPQDVTGIKVRDTLPTGVKYLSYTADSGFTCTHDGSATGGNVTCVGGSLPGTETEFYEEAGAPPPAPTGDKWATIKITFQATSFVQPTMHNVVRVDPDNEIAEINELNNTAFDDTTVTVGNGDKGAFNQLTITKTHVSPLATCGVPALVCVATNGTLIYDLEVQNLGTDPASQIVVKDHLPAGTRFIEASDTDPGPGLADAFFCFHDGSATGGIVTCIGGDLSGSINKIPDTPGPGDVPITRHIRIKVFAPNTPGVISNLATVDPDNLIPEGNEFDNDSFLQTRVTVGGNNMFNDLTISKCDEPNPPANDNGCTVVSDPVAPNQNITYVLKASNLGTDPAFNVKVTDVIPAGTTFVSAADTSGGAGAFTCVYGSGVITCTGGTLDGSQDLVSSDTFRTIKVVLTAPSGKGPITNQAFIDPDNAIAEGDETNNSDTETTNIIPRINLTLDKQGPTTAHQNDTDKYIITVKNELPAGITEGLPATDVVIVDALPIGLIPLAIEATPNNFICDFTENPVNGIRCIGDLTAPDVDSANAQVTITIDVFVTAKEGPLDNEACVDPTSAALPNGTIIESNEGDNCDTKTTTVLNLSPDISVNKSADVTTASPGQEITYTISVANVGDATAMAVTLTDNLDPDGTGLDVDFVSASGTNGYSCTFTSPNVECTTTTRLAPGDSATMTVKVKVKSGVTGPIKDKASVPDNTAFDGLAPECAGGNCKNEADTFTSSTNANNSDTVSVALGGTGIDLVMLSLDDDVDATAPGGIVTYTAKVANNGTADATGVLVRLALPVSGLNHVISSASNGFTCSFLFPNIDCTGSLPAGGTTEVTLVTNVTASAPPDTSVTVIATADPLSAIAEDDETNNEKTQITSVSSSCDTGCKDLVASPIVVTPASVHAGDVVTFIVGVGNAGDQNSGSFDIALKLMGTGFDFEPGGFDNTQPSDDYSASAGFDCTFAGDTVTCNGDLDGGEGVLIILNVHVKSPATDNNLTLNVKADSGTAVTEFSELNNEQSASATVAP
jgi:uncharacterized repeat protein (TIGR01451 family)